MTSTGASASLVRCVPRRVLGLAAAPVLPGLTSAAVLTSAPTSAPGGEKRNPGAAAVPATGSVQAVTESSEAVTEKAAEHGPATANRWPTNELTGKSCPGGTLPSASATDASPPGGSQRQ